MKAKFTLLAVAAVLIALPAAAGEWDAPTTEGDTGYFSMLSGETPSQGTWTFGAYYNNWDRVVTPVSCLEPPLTSDWDYDQNRLSASVGYSITDNLALSLMLPYDQLDASDNTKVGYVNGQELFRNIDAEGLGNLRLGAKWKIAGNADRDSALAVNAYVELPTGDEDEAVVTGGTGYGIGLNYNIHRWIFNVGYHDPGDADKVDVNEELIAGVGYLLPITDRLGWITEWLSYTATSSTRPNEPDHLDLTTGIRYLFGEDNRWTFNVALRNNLSGWSEGTDELGGLIGVTYRNGSGGGGTSRAPAVAPTPAPTPTPTPTPAPAPTAPPAPPEPPAAPEAPPAPVPEPVIETVLFDFGSYRVSNIGKAQLDEIALKMKQDPALRAMVIGYSDSRGSEAANKQVSLRRAEAVKAYLVSRHGLDASRISVEGHGSADPIGDNATAEGRAANRRVVIRVR